MNITQAKAAIVAISKSSPYTQISASRADGEWRVRLNGDPATDYFTDDNDDAVGTARHMAADEAFRLFELPNFRETWICPIDHLDA